MLKLWISGIIYKTQQEITESSFLGVEYHAVVEYAPFQGVPKKKSKKDPKNGTISEGAFILNYTFSFLENVLSFTFYLENCFYFCLGWSATVDMFLLAIWDLSNLLLQVNMPL